MTLGFYHPFVENLFNFIQRANPSDAKKDAIELLDTLAYQQKTCQKYTPRPLYFTETIQGNISFNRSVFLYLTLIVVNEVLHIPDSETHYSAASFLPVESIEDAWNTSLR